MNAMTRTEQYIRLRYAYPQAAEGVPVTTCVEELAGLLCCSPRNVKLILKDMARQNWIRWHAGRGRGNRSRIEFRYPLVQALEEYFQSLLSKGWVKEAVRFCQWEKHPPEMKERLHFILEKQFGLQVEQSERRKLDILKIPKRRPLTRLDPARTYLATEAYLITQIMDTLIRYDPETDTFLPHLAHAWESNADLSRWVFYLRKGVHFHHGKMLAAADVKYTVERLLSLPDDPAHHRDLLDMLEQVEIINDFTVLFHLKKPCPFWLHLLSDLSLSVLPSDVPFSDNHPIGTGPFKVVRFDDEKLILESFHGHFKEPPLLDRIEFWQVPPDTPLSMEYFVEETQQSAKRSQKSFLYQETGCRYLMFNFKKPGIQQDPCFRQAIRMLLDKQKLIEELGENRVLPANSFFPPKSMGFPVESHSLEKARLMLRQSAYNGETLKIYYFEKKEESEADARWLQERARQIGLNLSLHPFSLKAYYTDLLEREADMAMMGEVLESNVQMGFYKMFKSTSSIIRRFWPDSLRPHLENLLDRYIAAPTTKQRMKVADELEDLIRREHLLVFLYHVRRTRNYHPALSGLTVDSFGIPDLRKLWIKPKVKL